MVIFIIIMVILMIMITVAITVIIVIIKSQLVCLIGCEDYRASVSGILGPW